MQAPLPPSPPASPPASHSRETDLARAEQRGKQVLLYVPHGPLGGIFACSRCGASGLQPDLIGHRVDCPYRVR